MAKSSVSFRALCKLPFAAGVILGFFIGALLGSVFFRGERLRHFRMKNLSRAGRWMCRVTGISIRVKPGDGLGRAEGSGRLLVSNHLTYLDAVILSALHPSIFVTSVEVRNTFFLGQICRLSGCAFVERRNRSSIESELSEVTELLQKGFQVVLFPEATSTNGDSILPFKKSFFRAAVSARVPVLPVALQYLRIDGESVSPLNRDSVFYYGDLVFGPQFLSFLGLRSVEMEVRVAPRIESGQDSRVLAEQSYQAVMKMYQGVSSVESA